MDDFGKWAVGDASSWGLVALSALCVYVVLTLCVRVVGLRSFSKMSSTDFITTVAIGSLMAAVVSRPSPSVLIGIVAFLSIFVLKWVIAAVRRRTRVASVLLDNEPIYLMRGPEVLDRNLTAANVSLSELHSKLREANVWSYDQVVSVVLETTGDVSVLHRPVDNARITPAIFQDVRAERAEPPGGERRTAP